MTYVDIVINLHYEGFSGVQIHKKLIELFKEEAPAYSTLERHIRALSFNSTLKVVENITTEKWNPTITYKISNFLDFYPNSSVRYLSSHLNIPPTTVYRYLTEILKFKCFHLRWIPHPLTENIRSKRIKTSKQPLAEMMKAKKNGFHFFVTVDKSWFAYEYRSRTQWVKPGENPQTRVRKSLLTAKIMITIFWNKTGIQVLNALDEGMRMNSSYFIQNV